MVVAEAVPVPDTVVEHSTYTPSKPPTGTVSENCRFDPEALPVTAPRPLTFCRPSVISSGPENDLPLCVSCQVMVPAPEVSDAVPDHSPATFAGGVVGAAGWLPPSSPEHAVLPIATAAATAATAHRRMPASRRR